MQFHWRGSNHEHLHEFENSICVKQYFFLLLCGFHGLVYRVRNLILPVYNFTKHFLKVDFMTAADSHPTI